MKNRENCAVTGEVRLHFVRVTEPESYEGREPRYSCRVLIPKDDETTLSGIRKTRDGEKLEIRAEDEFGVFDPKEGTR